MALPVLKEKEEGATGMSPERDLIEIALRILLGLAVNFIARKIKKKSRMKADRRKAIRKTEKLTKKGKEIPEDLKEAAWGDLPRREKKKMSKKADKKAKKKAKKGGKKRGRKLLFLLFLLGAGAAVAFARLNKK